MRIPKVGRWQYWQVISGLLFLAFGVRVIVALIMPAEAGVGQNYALQSWQVGELVSSMAFSPDGKLLAVGTEHGAVQLRQVVSGTIVGTLSGSVSLAFSPDSKMLAVLDGSGKINVYETNTGALIRTLGPEGDQHQRLSMLAFSPDGQMLASYSNTGSIIFYSVSDWQLSGNLYVPSSLVHSEAGYHPLALGFSPGGE